MPTGFTAKLYDNKEISFEDFALDCARAFGALSSLRDDFQAEIPDSFTVDPSCYERVNKAKERLETIRNISRADLIDQATEYHDAMNKHNYEYAVRKNQMQERYLNMLDKVRAWTPPTSEHIKLKEFMTSQLTESIDHDCKEYTDLDELKAEQDSTLVDVDGYYQDKLQAAESSFSYAIDNLKKVEESEVSRDTWVKDLRASLKE